MLIVQNLTWHKILLDSQILYTKHYIAESKQKKPSCLLSFWDVHLHIILIHLVSKNISCFDYEHLEKICAFNANLIILDVARDEEAKPRCEGLECVGYLRHYTNALIVIKDCFIDSYQVLQAVVYGADGVMFNTESIALKELLAFAFRLGLMAFVEVTNLKEIKQAVLAKAEGFYLPNECFEELHPIIPKRKCLCTNIKERYCLESNQSESDIAHLFDLGVPSKSLQATRADFAFAHIEVI